MYNVRHVVCRITPIATSPARPARVARLRLLIVSLDFSISFSPSSLCSTTSTAVVEQEGKYNINSVRAQTAPRVYLVFA